MALNNRVKYVGQQLVDLTKLRNIEQFLANDFDALVGDSLAGGTSLVVSGLDCLNPSATNPLNLEFNQNLVAYLTGTTGSPAPVGVVKYTAVDPLKFSGTTFPNGTYKVYAVFGMVEGAASNSRFIDPTTKEEFVSAVPQNYELSVSLVCQSSASTAPANSIEIAQFVISGGVISGSVADFRPLMFVDGTATEQSSLKAWMDSVAGGSFNTLVVGNPTPGTDDYKYQIGYPVYGKRRVTTSFTSGLAASTVTLSTLNTVYRNCSQGTDTIDVPAGDYEVSLTGVLEYVSSLGGCADASFSIALDGTNLATITVVPFDGGAFSGGQIYYPVALTTIISAAADGSISLKTQVTTGTSVTWASAATPGSKATPLTLVVRRVGEAP